ncbi:MULTISPECIES: hypothetical protein [unclassified Streptomyces]|uniref:hypothetical protein n=1 Tax=unclassified Streptomyces TaxID=2593676 RepID=UPI00336A9A46
MEEPSELFRDLAHALVQALDAWAATVGQATDTARRPTRAGLVAELERERLEFERVGRNRKRIDLPLLSYWLKGRDQLLPGSKKNRLPSQEDCEAVARALSQKAPRSAQELPKIGVEIADLARRLKEEAGPGWRDEVLACLAPAATVATHGVSEVNTAPETRPETRAFPEAPAEPRRKRRGWQFVVATAIAVGLITGTMALRSGASEGDGASGGGGAVRMADLKGNHRCGPLRAVGAVSWRPCTSVGRDSLSFVVQLSNSSNRATTVKTRIAYVQARAEHECPAPWGTARDVTVPAGATVTSPASGCTVPVVRAQAFQARVFVAEENASAWGYREHSPTVHIQADGRRLWADQL